MYNFIVQAYALYKGLFYWLSVAGFISNVFVRPIALVLMYAVLGRFAGNPVAVQDYVLGVASYTMVMIVIPGLTQSYTYDRGQGTLAFLYASPANRFANFLSRMVFHYPNALLSFATSLITAWFIVDLNFGAVNWAGFFVALLVIAASIAAFGQFLGIFAIIFRDWSNVQAIAVGMLLILTGMIIPISIFPAGVQELVKLLPITNGLVAMRDAFIGLPLNQISGSILREMVTGIVYFTIGYTGFVVFERVAKQRGTLDIETF